MNVRQPASDANLSQNSNDSIDEVDVADLEKTAGSVDEVNSSGIENVSDESSAG